MHSKLGRALESLFLNVDVLNEELVRLATNEQFTPSPRDQQLIEHIRGSCIGSMQTLRTVERALRRAEQRAKPEADVLPFQPDA